MAEQRPHILLITTDQQRWDTIGDAKPPFMQTPHLDRLIHQGVWFRRAYADTPVCVPARMGIMSGKLSHGHGCSGNGPSSQFIGHDDTLPHYLGELGYETVAIGKMHFNPTRCHHGFQTFIHALDYYDQMKAEGLNPLAHGLGQTERYATMGTVPEHKTLTSWTAERARHFIERQRDPTQIGRAHV